MPKALRTRELAGRDPTQYDVVEYQPWDSFVDIESLEEVGRMEAKKKGEGEEMKKTRRELEAELKELLENESLIHATEHKDLLSSFCKNNYCFIEGEPGHEECHPTPKARKVKVRK